jgi:hypothetical protein
MGSRNKPPTDPLGHAHLVRRPERGHRYWLLVRICDALAGHRDGRQDGRVAVTARPSTGPVAPNDLSTLTDATFGDWPTVPTLDVLPTTMWLRRNEHTFEERDQREFLGTQASLASARSRLQALAGDAAALEQELTRAKARRAVVADEPDADALRRHGAAERFDVPQTIEMRRRREHQARIAALDSEVAASESRLAGVRREMAAIEGLLLTAFDVVVTRSHRLRFFHERRAAVYRRWHRRAWRWATRRTAQHADWPIDPASDTIQAPAWTTRPCPWLRPAANADSPHQLLTHAG